MQTSTKRLVRGAATLATTALLTLTTVSVAVADGHHSQTPSASCPATQGVIGTVSALSASGFTLTTANGTVDTVNVSSTTVYKEHGVSSATLSNVVNGDTAIVVGTNTSSTIAAETVIIAMATQKGGHHDTAWSGATITAGAITTIGANTFTITTTTGASDTVNVSNTTVYREHGASGVSFNTLTTGQNVAVIGTVTTGTVTALAIIISPAPDAHQGGSQGTWQGAPWPTVGTVSNLTSNSFTLTTPHGTQLTVTVSSATTYTEPGVASPTFTNVTSGESVIVAGTNMSGTISATSIGIFPSHGNGRGDAFGGKSFGGFGGGFGDHGH